MTPVRRTYLVDAARVMLALVAAAVPIAAAVAIIDPGGERAQLHYGFADVPDAPGQVVAILGENGKLLLAILVMTVLVQARYASQTPRARRCFVWYCDLVVTIPMLDKLVLPVGGDVGAYGWRMVIAMLPAGPLELAAYAFAASVYLHSRRAAITVAEISPPAFVATFALALLVVASLLETYG